MRKKFLIFSIVCLLFCTLNYTYSSFKNTIVGNISGNIKDWVFKVSIDNSTKYEDGYKLHLTGTSGSFNVNINTVGGSKNADYSIELIGDSSIKYYTNSSYTNLISNNIYNGSINSNTNGTVTIYYKSSSNIDDDIYVKTKGSIMEIAMMKNGYSGSNGGTEFWNNTYKPYIRTVEFGNDLSNLPSSCTEENLCWDISYDTSQKKKVYGYLIDSGYKDSTDNTKTLYNLYIVSETPIFAPSDCERILSFFKYENKKYNSNLIQINFNNNFDTSKATNMDYMFAWCSSLTSLDLSSFNTSNVVRMEAVFYSCLSLTSLDLSNFDTQKVTRMAHMFSYCSSLTSLDLSSFNTSNVRSMSYMFRSCSSLTSLDLNNFNNSEVTDMSGMFSSCSFLISLELGNFNTPEVTYMSGMFSDCSSLTSLNLSNFDTQKVTSMSIMFDGCSSLTSLDLSNFNTINVTNMMSMFSSCSSLISLDLSNFNTSNVINMYMLFSNCSSLTTLDLSSFNTSKVTDMTSMFQNCQKLQTEINIMNTSTTSYSYMFYGALTDANAYVILGYTTDTQTIAEAMKATASTANQSKITLKQI